MQDSTVTPATSQQLLHAAGTPTCEALQDQDCGCLEGASGQLGQAGCEGAELARHGAGQAAHHTPRTHASLTAQAASSTQSAELCWSLCSGAC